VQVQVGNAGHIAHDAECVGNFFCGQREDALGGFGLALCNRPGVVPGQREQRHPLVITGLAPLIFPVADQSELFRFISSFSLQWVLSLYFSRMNLFPKR
jgi:hypothetical protein